MSARAAFAADRAADLFACTEIFGVSIELSVSIASAGEAGPSILKKTVFKNEKSGRDRFGRGGVIQVISGSAVLHWA